MNITNPNAFWLLFLLIIPILIHLFQFRRYKKLKFSNVAFLKAINQEQKNTRKLKHLLILFSRLLFIFFFVMCIAKPFWPSDASTAEVNLIILDKSASNLSLAEGKANSVLEENMNLINRLQDQFPENLQIIDESGNALQAYDNIEINARSSEMVLDRLLEKHGNTGRVLILSDFQKQVIDRNKEVFSDTTRQFVIMPPYKESPGNIIWDSVWISGNELNTTLDESLILQLNTKGNPGQVNISLQENNTLIGNRQINDTENSSDTIGFWLNSNINQREEQLTFTSDDAIVTFDNTFYFKKENTGKIKVLLLEETQKDQNIRSLFEDNDVFDFENENINNYSFQRLDDFDVAIVKMGENFNSFKADALQAYAGMGKTLVLIPESDFNATELLARFGLNNVRKLQQNAKVKLQNPDIQNPFFRNIFKKTERNMDMPEAQAVMNWQSGQSLLSFINGYPFLSRTGKAQNIYTFSASIGLENSNFARHGLFLPVFYKIAFSGKSENTVTYHFLNEEIISFTNNDIPAATVLKLEKDNQQLIPDQRLQGGKISLILPEQEIMAGFYALKDAKTDTMYTYLAFNYPKAESENSFYTASDLEELFSGSKNVKVLEEYDVSTLENFLLESKNGFPLWKYFLILALLSLLAEVLIIRLIK
ncbi:BatA domain-containing protein [Marivirga sp. S37H4]|uniref:BatA domain-containing protein n=1 Tax=Marivirga aurantiaca TaxID=2802615 RepID=A0A934X049_9BACT|nr:BatA domain-containing protein [Marivirga aurantiaca]MBK6266032.1 BatA domain-containing protein [Marivirga aurantiaca]